MTKRTGMNTVRISDEVAARLDALCEMFGKRDGLNVRRADMIRSSIAFGLERLEAKHMGVFPPVTDAETDAARAAADRIAEALGLIPGFAWTEQQRQEMVATLTKHLERVAGDVHRAGLTSAKVSET